MMEDEHSLDEVGAEKYPDLPYPVRPQHGLSHARDHAAAYGKERWRALPSAEPGVFRGAAETEEN